MEKNFFEKEVKRIAKLSYIELSPDEEKQMIEHFRRMYEFVSRLKEVKTGDLKMLIYPHDEVFLRMEDDTPRKGISFLDVMKNAPDTFKEYIRTKSPIKGAKIKEK